MSYRSITGFLIENSVGQFHFRCEDTNKDIEVRFSDSEQADATPKWERIALSLWHIEADKYAVSSFKPWFTRLEGLGARVVLGDKFHIALFYGGDLGEDETRFQKYKARVIKKARIVEKYYTDYFNGKVDVKCQAFAFRTDGNPHAPNYCYPEMREWARQNPMEMRGFTPTHWHIWRGRSDAYSGLAPLGGNRGVTYLSAPVGVTIHELGHNLDLHHSSTRDSGGNESTYGDDSDIMGPPHKIPGLNVLNHLKLGLESEREILQIDPGDPSQQILVCPIEMGKHSLHEREWQCVKVGSKNAFSLRKSIGVEHPTLTPERLYLYDTASDGRAVRLLPDMMPGDVVLDFAGVTLHYVEWIPKLEIARINILSSDTLVPLDIPVPRSFPKPPIAANMNKMRSGVHYNWKFWGQGFDIIIDNGRCLVRWYGNNISSTDRNDYGTQLSKNYLRWWWGVGDIDSRGFVDFKLFTTGEADGVYPTFEDATTADVREVGSCRLYFLGDTGVFLYHTEELGRGSIELEPIAFSDNDQTGAYHEPVLNEQGIDIQRQGFSAIFHDYLGRWGKCTLYWYTYGPPGENRYNRFMPDTCQRWYMLLGEQTGADSGVYEMKFYEVHNGQLLHVAMPEDINLANAGSGILTVLDNDRMRLQYDLTAPDNLQTGTTELQRGM